MRVIEPGEAVLPPADLNKQDVWTFKKWRPMIPVKFEDGTEYRFPLQRLSSGGYDTSSMMDVSDPELAEKLKKAIEAGDTTLCEVN